MPIQNVALIGANGNLGPYILSALTSSPFTPFVLNRASSKSQYTNVQVLTVPDDLDPATITPLLKSYSIDALILAFEGALVEPAKKMIHAAFDAGVHRVIPADFGSCDSADPETVQLLPLMAGKQQVRELLIELARKERAEGVRAFTWTSLVTGHMFDWGLKGALLKFDVAKRKAYLIDGGDVKFSASNLEFIGRAAVRVLEREGETANRLLYVHSHWVTQKEVLEVLERVMGERWERVVLDGKEVIEGERPKMLEGDHDATEEIVAVHGLVASDWKGKEGFANELLGLEEEDLEQVIRRVVREMIQ
ncbi:NAD(P)-binding protein [Polyplosphaeria fusca]|uniref:NAD(P)-binding protein n=1 Tax=Polyplosphaeria fusca TaxID=682080 RepID=A0A9P4R3Y5_9PLEO|nr:NAD(P)-binding protein [Polyplosphaeria fusca]